MTYQGHLLIGELAKGFPDVHAIYKKLGIDHPALHDSDKDIFDGRGKELSIPFRGKEERAYLQAYMDEDGDGCCVAFRLTSRYKGALLDKDSPHGREEPFVVNMEELAGVLAHVRTWWPDAQVILWTLHF